MKKNISDTIEEVLNKELNISEESRLRLEQIKNDCNKSQTVGELKSVFYALVRFMCDMLNHTDW